MLGLQVYSAMSGAINSWVAVANGANPFQVIGVNLVSNLLNQVLPGGGIHSNILMNMAASAARGAVIGAATSLMMGQNPGIGAIGGGISGAGIGFVTSNQFQSFLRGVVNPGPSAQSIQQQAQNLASDGQTQAAIDMATGVEEKAEAAKVIAKTAIGPGGYYDEYGILRITVGSNEPILKSGLQNYFSQLERTRIRLIVNQADAIANAAKGCADYIQHDDAIGFGRAFFGLIGMAQLKENDTKLNIINAELEKINYMMQNY
jgi:hypothetical protein